MGKARAAKAARKLERDRWADVELWHGGIGGLSVGSEVVPPADQEIDDPMRSSLYLAEARADRVYFTSDRDLARVFASAVLKGRGSGAVYRVRPVGNVLTDPDFPTVGYHARRALILDVEDQTEPMTSEDEQRVQSAYMTWDDGRPMYDADGRIQITWQMEELGLTQAVLDQRLPRWVHPEVAMSRVSAALGQRRV
ncbi:hypothetical protein FM104_04665 [Microbacterium esteraromaticum]|uniref:Uncharacterized protein n=1 Tax=Microbacterium esteraromaticum TaxID=57043 RepID=A0A1R4IYK0_9MICO|nr:hypothetical protein [Microbacterium esteraromaticum]SJN24966.1 hypothetical protein FM104_04665 [Microbacterium esteraromaticum]